MLENYIRWLFSRLQCHFGKNIVSIKCIFNLYQLCAFQKLLANSLFLTRPQAMSSTLVLCFKTSFGDKPMASSTNKQRPAHVPEENVYTSPHWLMIATYAVSAVALFMLINSAG